MARESRISATSPTFAHFLLPILKQPFTRRCSPSSSCDATDRTGSSSSTPTTPSSSPPGQQQQDSSNNKSRNLSRTAPDTIRCRRCSCDLAFASQIVSKGFTGRHGRALLVAAPPPPADPTLLNIRTERSENRQLATGWHVVADISCNMCATKLGWTYVNAREESQKYKVGKFILETERVVVFRNWDDMEGEGMGGGGGEDDEEGCVMFDSEDEDECEDVFAGTWDAGMVAERRMSEVLRERGDGESAGAATGEEPGGPSEADEPATAGEV